MHKGFQSLAIFPGVILVSLNPVEHLVSELSHIVMGIAGDIATPQKCIGISIMLVGAFIVEDDIAIRSNGAIVRWDGLRDRKSVV